MILERTTPAYARGYRDCANGRPKMYDNDGTFYGHDYDEGWAAAFNDAYWRAVRDDADWNLERCLRAGGPN